MIIPLKRFLLYWYTKNMGILKGNLKNLLTELLIEILIRIINILPF